MLQNAPFDILHHVFESMDPLSLCSLCLVSRYINDIASPILYRIMIWGVAPNSPWTKVENSSFQVLNRLYDHPVILAFQRRPSLRSSVHKIIFKYIPLNKDDDFAQDYLRYTCHQLSTLPCVITLEWRNTYSGYPMHSKHFNQLLSLMMTLTSLQEVVFPVLSSPIDLPTLFCKRLRTARLPTNAYYPLPHWMEVAWFPILSHLKTLEIKYDLTATRALKVFRHLRILKLGLVNNPAELISSIGETSELIELRFRIRLLNDDQWQFQLPDPVSFCHLRFLCIGVAGYHQYSENAIPRLRSLYGCIASRSNVLEELYIPFDLDNRRYDIRSDKLQRDIIHFHGTTIRSLRLDTMTLSPTSVLKLVVYCPNVQKLGLFVDGDDLHTLLSTLRMASSLTVLLLSMSNDSKAPTDREIESFMTQELSQLRKWHMRYLWSYPNVQKSWESHWAYDPDTGKALRAVSQCAQVEDWFTL